MTGRKLLEAQRGGTCWRGVVGCKYYETWLTEPEFFCECEVPAPESKAFDSSAGAKTKYYYPKLDSVKLVDWSYWGGYDFDYRRLLNGLVYLNPEDAIARAKAMLIVEGVIK